MKHFGSRYSIGTLQEHLPHSVQEKLSAAATLGAAVALVVDGRPVPLSGIGFRDLERTVVLDTDARFYVYSVTKTLLAVITLQLVEQGHVSLDAPVQTYLPELPLATPVTVRQLLNHSGGVPDYGSLRAYFEAVKDEPAHPWTSGDFLARTLAGGMSFVPGQGWAYSNVGYLIIRLLIERVTNSSLAAAMQRHLFQPLGLRHAFVAQTLEDVQHLTPGYSAFFSPDDSLQNVIPFYHPGWVSHGVVATTAAELGHLFESLFTGRLLPPELVQAMVEPVTVPHRHPLFRQPAYGLGLMIDLGSPYGLVTGHGGGGPGYSTAALHLPDVAGRRVTAVALANRDQPDLGLQIALALAETLAVV